MPLWLFEPTGSPNEALEIPYCVDAKHSAGSLMRVTHPPDEGCLSFETWGDGDSATGGYEQTCHVEGMGICYGRVWVVWITTRGDGSCNRHTPEASKQNQDLRKEMFRCKI